MIPIGDTRLCLSKPVDTPHGATNGGGKRRRNGGVMRHPECSQRATPGPEICANTSVERKASSSTKSRLLCNQCCNERRLEQGERELTASKWRELVEQEAFSRKAVGSMWHGTSRTQSVETFHQQKKLGPDRFRQLQNVSGEVEQTAGGNMRRRTGRSSSLSRTTATSASEVC